MGLTEIVKVASGFAVVILMGSATGGGSGDFEDWMDFEYAKAKTGIESNIAPVGTLPGFVIASPSTWDPNYYFHWTRDAALTMTALIEAANATASVRERDRYFSFVSDFADLTLRMQSITTMSGSPEDHFANIGEPKFNPDGSGFTGEWGRPQADGPALRVITLLNFMNSYHLSQAKSGDPDFGHDRIERLRAAVKADLEYVTCHGQQTSFDIWEESKGHHFYTEMVQRRALLMAADDAHAYGELVLEQRYRAVAESLTKKLPQHWDEELGYLVETLDRDDGIDYKLSNLDSGVILASLHAAGNDGFFAPTDDRILATAFRLKTVFKGLYPINLVTEDLEGRPLGAAIGRYPEDRYDGAKNTAGHPWPLITIGMAELNYRIAQELLQSGEVKVTTKSEKFYRSAVGILRHGDKGFSALIDHLISEGDSYIARVRYHTQPGGELSEQIDRNTGKMRSAYDLTWSYAAYLTAIHQRQRAMSAKAIYLSR